MKKLKLSKKHVVKIAISLGVLAVGSYMFVSYQNTVREQAVFAQTMARTAEVLTVDRSGLQDILTASGTIQLKDETQVVATSSGKVAEIYVSSSDFVHEGQAIVRYDIQETKENLERQLIEAEINLANQQLSLRSLALPPTEAEIKSLSSRVTTAERGIMSSERGIASSEKGITVAERNITNAERTISDRQRAVLTAEDTYASTLERIEQQNTTIRRLEKDLEDNLKLLEVGAITEESYQRLLLDHENALLTLSDHEKTLQNNLDSIEEAKRNVTYAEEELKNVELELTHAKRDLDNSLIELDYARRDLNDALLELADAPNVLTEESERINYERQLNQIKLNELSIQTIKKDLEALVEEGISSATGTVSVVNTEKYASVQQGTTLITVADYTDLILAVDISEYDAFKLALGQTVEMYSDAMPDVIYEGEIVKIDPSAVTKSTSGGTETVLPIEISIKNPGTIIRPGYTLDADITLVNKENIINIPISAIQRDPETREQFVFIVDANNVLHKTTVQLGLYGDLNVEIVSGLSDGDTIVLSPTATMTDGMTIIIGVPDRSAGRAQGAPAGLWVESSGGNSSPAPAGRSSGAVRLP